MPEILEGSLLAGYRWTYGRRKPLVHQEDIVASLLEHSPEALALGGGLELHMSSRPVANDDRSVLWLAKSHLNFLDKVGL